MEKIIVRKDDAGIMIIIPNKDKYGEGKLPYSECKALKRYIDMGYSWFLTSEENIKDGLESREQLYHDGTDEIKKDLNWQNRLMPSFLIKKKHIKKENEKLDAMLNADIKDPIEIIKLNREIEKVKSFTDKQIYEQALINLDARVAANEPDKPKIRQKIQQKITDLSR